MGRFPTGWAGSARLRAALAGLVCVMLTHNLCGYRSYHNDACRHTHLRQENGVNLQSLVAQEVPNFAFLLLSIHQWGNYKAHKCRRAWNQDCLVRYANNTKHLLEILSDRILGDSLCSEK